MITAGITDRVLHVSDQGVVPVDDVEGAIGCELEIDGTEIGIGRRAERIFTGWLSLVVFVWTGCVGGNTVS